MHNKFIMPSNVQNITNKESQELWKKYKNDA
jgi:hypothetical protein